MFAPTPTEDWQLLSDAVSGLDELFERHKDYVFRLAWGFLGEAQQAEDVTQEVFLRLAKGRKRFRRRGKLRTLLYQITLNTCREVRRRQARAGRLANELTEITDVAAMPLDPRLTDLTRALDGLSERQREAVVLRFYEGLDTRETAQVMGCREGSVKSHLHRALGALRLALTTQKAQPGPWRLSRHNDPSPIPQTSRSQKT